MVEGLGADNWAEDFLGDDPHVRLGILEHSRRDEIAKITDPHRLMWPVMQSNCPFDTSGPISVAGVETKSDLDLVDDVGDQATTRS